MIDQIVLVHSDTVVGNLQSIAFGIGGNLDFEFSRSFGNIRMSQCQILKLVTGIAGIRNQLPQKNMPLRI